MDYTPLGQHPAVRRIVFNFIGMDAIRASTDPYFNDIPLEKWEKPADILPTSVKREFVTDYVVHPALATWVCILKEAARQLKEEQ